MQRYEKYFHLYGIRKKPVFYAGSLSSYLRNIYSLNDMPMLMLPSVPITLSVVAAKVKLFWVVVVVVVTLLVVVFAVATLPLNPSASILRPVSNVKRSVKS